MAQDRFQGYAKVITLRRLRKVRVVVLEAGIDYVEQLRALTPDGVSGPQA